MSTVHPRTDLFSLHQKKKINYLITNENTKPPNAVTQWLQIKFVVRGKRGEREKGKKR